MSSFAQKTTVADELKSSQCKDQILQLLKSWQVENNWHRVLSNQPDQKVFRGPTKTLGKWVEMKIKNQQPDRQQVQADLFTENSVLSIEWEKDCQSKAVLKSRHAKDRFQNKEKYEGFKILRDQQLVELINSKKAGLIYVWTPHKPISVDGLKQAKKAAEKLKLPLYSVVDPNSSAESVKQVVKDLKLSFENIFYFNSFELQYRGMRLHYPSLIVFNQGQWASQVRRGYEDAAVYEEYLKSILEI